MSALSHYLSRNVAGRPSKKQLEIAPGIALPLTVHVHTQPGKNPIRAALTDDQGNEVENFLFCIFIQTYFYYLMWKYFPLKTSRFKIFHLYFQLLLLIKETNA